MIEVMAVRRAREVRGARWSTYDWKSRSPDSSIPSTSPKSRNIRIAQRRTAILAPVTADAPPRSAGAEPGTGTFEHRRHAAASSHQLVGVLMVAAAAVLFSLNGTVSKIVLTNGLSSQQLVETRCAAAAVVFFIAAVARDRTGLRVDRRELAFLAVYGVVGIAMVQWLYFVAISRMPVSITLLVEFTAPIMVALWVRFVRHEPVRGRVWAALTLSLVGLAMVAQVWDGLTVDGVGLLAASGGAVSLAAYYLMGERGLGSHAPVSLAAWTFALAAVFWSVAAPWWHFPFAVLDDRIDLGAATGGNLGGQAPTWLLVAWVVLLGTAAPFGLVFHGLHRIGAARTGLIGTSEPVIAGALAWVFLDEVLNAVQIAGGLVVLTGILLAETARPIQARPDETRPTEATNR